MKPRDQSRKKNRQDISYEKPTVLTDNLFCCQIRNFELERSLAMKGYHESALAFRLIPY